MKLDQFFTKNFNTQRDQWEKILRAELKTDEVSARTTKKSVEGAWPTLFLEAPQTHQFQVREPWKKAAQTYVEIPANFETELKQDLDSGVRAFFFEKDFLADQDWSKAQKVFASFPDSKDLVVVLLGDRQISYGQEKYRIIDEGNLAHGRGAHAPGGTNVQELAQLALSMIDRLADEEIHLAVYLDSHFFRNIAKARAARLLAMKILEVAGLKKKVYLVGLTSYRDWTLYERYSNLLRNDASVASGYIGGCDLVQSSGYETLFELEKCGSEGEHGERSRRMARNTSHILSLESALGVVEDASFGSYHIESLTEEYAREAWNLMQKTVTMTDAEVNDFFLKETAKIHEERMKNFAIRKHVLAGVNDFPDTKDNLGLKSLPNPGFFRTARAFEELRLKMENLPQKPEVYLAIFGDYAALNARMNFVKNYFELLGLKVMEPGKGITDPEKFSEVIQKRHEEFLVLVASDDDYSRLGNLSTKAPEKFIAGKIELPGYTNLFAGQNVYDVLSGIVSRWGKK